MDECTQEGLCIPTSASTIHSSAVSTVGCTADCCDAQYDVYHIRNYSPTTASPPNTVTSMIYVFTALLRGVIEYSTTRVWVKRLRSFDVAWTGTGAGGARVLARQLYYCGIMVLDEMIRSNRPLARNTARPARSQGGQPRTNFHMHTRQ